MQQLNTIALLYPNCIEYEIMLALEFMNKKFAVKVATPSGNEHRGSSGIRIQADMKFENIDVSMVKCILVPGGDPYDIIEDEALQPVMKQLLHSANSRGVLIGAICAGPAILGKYEILKGKKFTHGYGDSHKDYLASL